MTVSALYNISLQPCMTCQSVCRYETSCVCYVIQEEDELIAEWQPEPLIPKGYPGDHSVDDAPIVTGLVA